MPRTPNDKNESPKNYKMTDKEKKKKKSQESGSDSDSDSSNDDKKSSNLKRLQLKKGGSNASVSTALTRSSLYLNGNRRKDYRGHRKKSGKSRK